MKKTAVLKEVKKVCNDFNAGNFEYKVETFDFDEGLLTIDGRQFDCSNMRNVQEVVDVVLGYLFVQC